ncbi:metallophosphoesterase family protein [Ornithinibacillus xuwenensis]|uniref:Phosphoesterase n=1 Tax=Ornithinibacillus xuwenensis TaxID=3144668 RepID=A0ABU9XFR0_9BACI
MTSVVILSDSHGLREEILEIRARHQADYAIHCGDSELEENAKELEDVITVAGNCDFTSSFPTEQKKTIDGVTFFIVHGHLHQVKMNLLNLTYRADEVNASIVCFGHTHIAGAEKVGQKLFINPGSILLPRMRPEKTYTVLSWQAINSIEVNYFTLTGDRVDGLSFVTSIN